MKSKYFHKIKAAQGGFTLIELLVVIGILAILLAITLIAINPSKHFQDTRNAQRSSDVTAYLNGIYEYEAANNGNAPKGLASVTTAATKLAANASVAVTGIDTSASPSVVLTATNTGTITTGYANLTGCGTPGNNGTFPVTAGTATTFTITNSNAVSPDATCSVSDSTGMANLCDNLVSTFIAALPKDPSATSPTCVGAYDSGYTITKSLSGDRFTVSAPNAEGGAVIEVTR
ncbi:MAG: type II secretion system protein [Candidatus Saccharimonadales bacterium]